MPLKGIRKSLSQKQQQQWRPFFQAIGKKTDKGNTVAKPSFLLGQKFVFSPTPGQNQLFHLFDQFLLEDIPCMLLKGFAGTGKTTVVSALVKVLPFFNFKALLLAPTGRAAKVMSLYADKSAFTIHKMIYSQVGDPGNSALEFKRQKNYSKNTIFIVDEASMLTNDAEFGKSGLLADLYKYVFQDSTNKLLLVGDSAQLPPVGKVESPALSKTYLTSTFDVTVIETELKEVVRQEEKSGILDNATRLRGLLDKEKWEIAFHTSTYKDVFRMNADKLEDGLRYAYDKYGVENSTIICRSNKSAVQYNQYIRRNIHFTESEIDAGDFLMIVKNNYHYNSPDTKSGFLANGDFVEVQKIVRFEDIYGFRFADLVLKLTDYPDQEAFEAKVILDTLHSHSPSLFSDDYAKLYHLVKEDYADISSPGKIKEKLKTDPYLNALQIKFAYALTCHKAQGGQWKAVFVDQGYLTEDRIDKEYIRWLYTAVTRATDELFLVNFKPNFFC